jgi:hypothetical protein
VGVTGIVVVYSLIIPLSMDVDGILYPIQRVQRGDDRQLVVVQFEAAFSRVGLRWRHVEYDRVVATDERVLSSEIRRRYDWDEVLFGESEETSSLTCGKKRDEIIRSNVGVQRFVRE